MTDTYSTNQTVASGDDSHVDDVKLLSWYCSKAFAPQDDSFEELEAAERSWDNVRDYLDLNTRSREEMVLAAELRRDDSGMTALHFACRNAPPLDIVEFLLDLVEDTARWADSLGLLPIHYACAFGSGLAVIKKLIEVFPESRTCVDNNLRTPLLLAFSATSELNRQVPTDMVALLSSSGAAALADKTGMLPLHYACALGATEENLYVLTGQHPEAISTADKSGRLPIQMALSNATKKEMPAVVRHLVSMDKNVVNEHDGRHPVRILSVFALSLNEVSEEEEEAVGKCLEYILTAEPEPTADFFTALQSLPNWLSERAVVMPEVQALLNMKITQKFPSAVNLSDIVMILLTCAFYYTSIISALKFLHDPDEDASETYGRSDDGWAIYFLFLGGFYFFFREVLQIISFVSLNAFHMWFNDISKLVANVAFIVLVFYWSFKLFRLERNSQDFSVEGALSIMVLCYKLITIFSSQFMGFAVFVGGLTNVLQRLAAFLVCLFICLIMFSQMFYTIFRGSEECSNQEKEFEPYGNKHMSELIKMDVDRNPYCNYIETFLRAFTMLLGELVEAEFLGYTFRMIVFSVFEFLCVILLANVLIAIVTDSYKVIQDQRAAVVFWTNRLDFVAEMDAVANGPWRKKLATSLGIQYTNARSTEGQSNEEDFGFTWWEFFMSVLYEEGEGDVTDPIEVIFTFIARVATVFIVGAWIILGLFTLGIIWPPQIRESLFSSKIVKHATESEKENELRKTQVLQLEAEVNTLKDELVKDLAIYRTQVVQMKNSVSERKAEIANEMKHVKRIVTMLFEQQASFG